MGWGGGSKKRKCTVWPELLELLNRGIIVVKMKSRSKIRKRAGATAPFAKSCASYCRFARSFVSVKRGKRFFSGKFPPRWTVPFARNFRAIHTNRKRSRILLSFLFLFFYGLVGKYSLICATEIQKIQMVVHFFSGFALFTELMSVSRSWIALQNKMPFDLPTNECKAKYCHHLKTCFIWTFSRERLLWTGYASGGSLRKKPQSPAVKY